MRPRPPRPWITLALALVACVDAPADSSAPPAPSLAGAPGLVARVEDRDGPRLVAVSPAPGAVDAPLVVVTLDFEDASGLDPRATTVALTAQGAALAEGRDLVRDERVADRLTLVLDPARAALDLRVVPVDRLGHAAAPIDLTWRPRNAPLPIVAPDDDAPRDDTPLASRPPELTPRLAPIIGPTLVPIVDALDADGDLVALDLRLADGQPLARLALDPPAARASLAHDFAGAASGPLALVVEAMDAAGGATRPTLAATIDAEPPTLVIEAPAAPLATAFTLVVDAADPVAGLALVEARVVTAEAAPTVLADVEPGATSARLTLPLDAPPGEHLVVVSALDRVGNTRTHDVPVIVKEPDDSGVVPFVSPPHGASLIAPTTPIVLHLAGSIVAPGAPAGPFGVSVDGAPAAGRVAASDDVRTFTPDAPWPPGALVEVTIAGLATPDGAPLARLHTNFRVRPYAFIDVAADSPSLLDYRGGTGEPGENHGPGGLFADLDGDGYPDLVLAAAPRQPLFAWRNVAASTYAGRAFEPTPLAPPSSRGQAGVVGGDVDNDGDLDLFVAVWNGPDRLYRNLHAETGAFAFVDQTAETGLATSLDARGRLDLAMTAAFADVDRDGRLDLFVGHHNGHWRSPQVGDLPGQRDTLFRQLDDGTFVDVTDAAGVPGWSAPSGAVDAAEHRASSTDAALFVDLDADRWPDLIVTNKLRHPDDRQMIYRNRGAGPDGAWLGFEVLTYTVDPALPEGHDLPMGIDANDLDHDGDLDLYVSDWTPYGTTPGPNAIWKNRFAELGKVDLERAPGATGVYSWGVQLQDFDNDGHLDVHVATNVLEWDLLYRGPDLVDVAAAADVRQRQNSRGSMSADLDRDGRLDLVVVNLDAPPRVYWNRHAVATAAADGDGQHWLTVKLIGDPDLPGPLRSTRDAIGARLVAHVDLDGDGIRETMAREVRSGSSNAASTSSLELELGLGAATAVDLEVRWPSGRDTWRYDVPVDRFMTIVEGAP